MICGLKWKKLFKGFAKKTTLIAGYCASSSECFDHCLKKDKNFLKIEVIILMSVVIQRSEGKTNRV